MGIAVVGIVVGALLSSISAKSKLIRIWPPKDDRTSIGALALRKTRTSCRAGCTRKIRPGSMANPLFSGKGGRQAHKEAARLVVVIQECCRRLPISRGAGRESDDGRAAGECVVVVGHRERDRGGPGRDADLHRRVEFVGGAQGEVDRQRVADRR